MIVKGTAKEMKDSLAHLPEYIKKLHKVTERICKAKIEVR